MTVTLSAISGWGSEVGALMTSAATTLESVAPSGAFAGVLAKVSAALEAGPGAATTPKAAGGSGPQGTATGATGATGLGGATGLAGASGGATYSALSFLPGVPSTGAGTSGLAGIGGAGGSTGAAVVGEAERFLGTPYVWGGATPGGFDCSGLVQYVYGQLGVQLPRTSEQQALVGTPVASLATAKPGDLVFFAGSDGTPTSPGHVGIYVGNGMMIDAPYTGTVVQVQPVSSAGTPVAIRRVLGTAGLGAAAGGAVDAASGGTGVPAALAPLFQQAAATYGVPAALLTAVARHESGFDPSAVSAAGAEGLMQIMPATASGLGVTPFTARQAIDGAARILHGDLAAFRSVPLALAAYNAGAGAVQAYGGIPPYAQTQSYVQDIMRTLEGS